MQIRLSDARRTAADAQFLFINAETLMKHLSKTYWLPVALFVAVGTAAAQAQTTDPRCEKMLSLQTLTTSVGAGFRFSRAKEDRPGRVECSWINAGSGPLQTLHIESANQSALSSDGKLYSPEKNNDDMWEFAVKNTEEGLKAKRQTISGIGKRAATVSYQNSQIKAFVLRDKDMLSVVVSGIAPAKLTTLLKAIGTP